MEEKRTGLFENGLIWFGAGVSIAEILTGTYLAPLGMGKGLLAIIVGHIIGCLMLFLAGVIGGKVRKSAMETVKMSFGQKGSILHYTHWFQPLTEGTAEKHDAFIEHRVYPCRLP